MAKELFLTLSAHHHEVFTAAVVKARRECKTFEEIAIQHAETLLSRGNYLFLKNPENRQKFIVAEAYALKLVESEGLYDNDAVRIVSDFYTGQDGLRHRFFDWFCKNGCGNYSQTEEGERKCIYAERLEVEK